MDKYEGKIYLSDLIKHVILDRQDKSDEHLMSWMLFG
jgi:hypothetical protein